MKKNILIIAIALVLLLGVGVALEFATIKQTDLTFDANKIVVPLQSKQTPQEYAQKIIGNLSISDISCNDVSGKCVFSIYKSKTKLITLSFDGTNKTSDEIISIRDKQTNLYLDKLIIDYAEANGKQVDIGGNGEIIIK